MDNLPLELKQRICSFLQASPQLLKPIRRVSKDFASAAAPCLIPRAFLFKHTHSCTYLWLIAQHPIFSKHLTTLVLDPSNLKKHKTFQAWLDDHQGLQDEYPSWWDFKPEDIDYDEDDGDPLFYDAESRSKWLAASREFEAAVKKVAKDQKDFHEHHWKSQQNLASHLSSKYFRGLFIDTIVEAFKLCPNLVNIVIASPQPDQEHVMSRKFAAFNSIHPHPGAWVDFKSHDPSEFSLLELLSAVDQKSAGLHSLTIIGFPFNCADYSKIASLKSLESLKHIRIGYDDLMDNPTTKFGFNLEKVIGKASVLESLWLNMPDLESNIFDGDAMLSAINSEFFRDIILHNVTVSEDSLVDFLLRHSQSLQKLSIGVTLKTGTWVSIFRRISGQMTALITMQIAYIRERKASDIIELSHHWWLKARYGVFEGGRLREPSARDEEGDTSGFYEGAIRSDDPTEKGLWEDYDARLTSMY
jgi:hypothetical protein